MRVAVNRYEYWTTDCQIQHFLPHLTARQRWNLYSRATRLFDRLPNQQWDRFYIFLMDVATNGPISAE